MVKAMKKLKLNLDDLRVESFETVSAKGKTRKGTVMGYKEWFTEEACTFLQQETCGPGQTGGECVTQYVSCEDCTGFTCTAECGGC